MVRAQLSIDFIIVFSFVLIIFVLIFGLVATQRIQTSQQQDYAQLQVVAQSIAQDINTAASSGSGYSQNLSLPSGTGLVNYNISITSSGTVVVYDNSTGRYVYAYAYAPVGRVISSQSYVSANSPHTYMLPVASGTIYLQNSDGNICIDYVCNTTTSQSSGFTVYTKLTHVAQMNGQNSYAYMQNSVSLLAPFNANAITMSAWVYINEFPTNSMIMPVVNYGTSQQGSYCFGPRIYVLSNSIYGGFQNINRGSSEASLPIKSKTWYFVAFTYSKSSNQITLYVNGRETIVNAVVPLDPAGNIYNLVFGTTDYTYNSGQGVCESSDPLNGSMANVQIYSSALSSNQIYGIESGGINGGPAISQNLSGWWPLNGNANDYSGNLNNGRASAVLYPAVAQINANVTNTTLSPVKGDLVGFSSTLGTFQGGVSSTYNITNNNGVASAFLMQTNNTGYATVKVTPFEGNVYTAKNLSGWWPLNGNQGNVLFNLANNTDAGYLENGYWNNVNYAGLFSGYGGYVSVPNSSKTELYNGPLTLSFWISPSQANKLESVVFKPDEYIACVGNGRIRLDDGSDHGVNINYNLTNNKWYNIVFTVSSTKIINVSVNGEWVGSVVNNQWAASANVLNMAIGSEQSYSAGSCSGAGSFDGKIANVQLYSYSISPDNIQLLYSEGIGGSPIPNSNNVGWWPLNGNTNDYSGNGNNGFGIGSFSFASPNQNMSYVGNTHTFVTTQFFGGVLGKWSNITVNTINNYQNILNTGSFTITAWVNLNQTGNYTLAGDYKPGSNSGFMFSACGTAYSGTSSPPPHAVLIVAGQKVLMPYVNSTVGSGSVHSGYLCFPPSTWEMISAEYNGSTGVATVYLNNEVYATNTLSPRLDLSPSEIFNIGGIGTNLFAGQYRGYISNVQLYSSTLSSADINTLYKSGFYGMPRPNDGIVAWWPLNGNANDYSGNGNNGYSHGTAYTYLMIPSPVPGLDNYGISSINSGNTAIMTPISYQHFSIASWVYLSQPVSNSGIYLGTRFLGSGYGLFRSSSEHGFLVGTGSAVSKNITMFPIDKWTYVVGTFDGKNISYYVDGTLAAKGTSSASGMSSNPLIVGPNLAGSVANIEYYNTSLTPGQVYQLYVNQLPATYTEQIPLSWGT